MDKMISEVPYYSDLKTIEKFIPGLNKLDGSKILITGANGLIGSAVADLLLSYGHGIEICAATRSEAKFNDRFGKTDCKFVKFDSEIGVMTEENFDYVIHTASPANPRLYATEPVETMLVNIKGLDNMIRFSRSHGVKRILYVSSSEVYGRTESYKEFEEKDYGFVDIESPRSCYPSAKRACETLLASYKSEYGLDYVTVRPGHVFGPTANKSDTRASTAFFYDVLEGKNIVMKSAGSQRRSYCYVPDCASAILAVLASGAAGEAYNISNVRSCCTIRELAECISECSGTELVFENPSDKEKAGYNQMENSVLNARKLEDLGWSGCFDLKDGVMHTLESMGKIFREDIG